MAVTDEPSTTVAFRPLAGVRVLVVEDAPLLSELMRAALDRLGATMVGPYETVNEARAGLQSEPKPHAGLLDVNLADGTVHPLLPDLRSTGIPYAFVTATCDPDRELAGESAPVVRKPYRTSDIAAVLHRLLEATVSGGSGHLAAARPEASPHFSGARAAGNGTSAAAA